MKMRNNGKQDGERIAELVRAAAARLSALQMQWRKAAGEWQQQLDQHQVEEAAGRGRRERRELAAARRFSDATAIISSELQLVF